MNDSAPKLGSNSRPIRPFVLPADWHGKLWVWRFLILRRVCQIGVLLLFFGTLHWAWQLAGQPLLAGNLSSSEVVGLVPLADPFAVLQILFTGHWVQIELVIGALIVLLFYGALGGRVWCSWVCPINMVTDLAGWLHTQLGIRDAVNLGRHLRYAIL
ncbi:MAG: 4Fe-4S binding protein, partial [Candidatus Competibacteraceae bacterium]|nr:4Fe-4S binding protein [Candidatus Competibacteraceae bacterium]